MSNGVPKSFKPLSDSPPVGLPKSFRALNSNEPILEKSSPFISYPFNQDDVQPTAPASSTRTESITPAQAHERDVDRLTATMQQEREKLQTPPREIGMLENLSDKYIPKGLPFSDFLSALAKGIDAPMMSGEKGIQSALTEKEKAEKVLNERGISALPEAGARLAYGAGEGALGLAMATTPVGVGFSEGQSILEQTSPDLARQVGKVLSPTQTLFKPQSDLGKALAGISDVVLGGTALSRIHAPMGEFPSVEEAKFADIPTEERPQPSPEPTTPQEQATNVRKNPQAHFRVSQIERDFQDAKREGKPYDIAQHYTDETARTVGADESATQRFQDLTQRVQEHNASLKQAEAPPVKPTPLYDGLPDEVKSKLSDSGIPAEKFRQMNGDQINKIYKDVHQKGLTEEAQQHPKYEDLKKITDEADVRLDEIRGKKGEERVGFTDNKTKHTRSLPIKDLTPEAIRSEIESIDKTTTSLEKTTEDKAIPEPEGKASTEGDVSFPPAEQKTPAVSEKPVYTAGTKQGAETHRKGLSNPNDYEIRPTPSGEFGVYETPKLITEQAKIPTSFKPVQSKGTEGSPLFEKPKPEEKGLFDDENGLKGPSGKLMSGIDPRDIMRALGIKPSRAAFNSWIKKFGFKASNLEELANAKGPFGQPFLRKPTPSGEMPTSLKLPWIDPEQPIEGTVKELGFITSKLKEGLSPGTVFRQAFEGRINNPINDALEAAQTKYVNMQEMESFTKRTLRGVTSAEDAIRKSFEPIIKEYQPLYNQLMKLSEFDGEELHFKKGSEAQARALWDQMKTMLRQRDLQLTELARKYPDVRIYLAAEDKIPPAVNVPTEEMAKANGLKTLLNSVVKRDLERVGIKTRQETYMPHIVDKDDFGQLNLFDNSYLPKELQFEHRQFLASSWMPSARAAMENYIPRVSEKIGYHPFYEKWTPYFESKEMTPELRHYFEQFVKEGIKRRQTGVFDTVLNSFVSLDFLRLMGGSLSAPFKHVFKYVGNAAAGQLPITVQATGRTLGGILNMIPRKLGITNRTFVERAAPEFVTSRALLALMDEIPQDRMTSMIQRARKYANTVAPIEWAENAQEVMSTMIASSYSNLDPISVRQAIWDRISRFNFRSGPDQPLLMKKTGARAATMFQMTPWKLLEQKVQLTHDAIIGQKDVFGDLYTMKLARMLFIIGTTEAVARKYGYSILDKYIHIPFTVQGSGPIEATEEDDQKYKLSQPKFQPPPAVQLAQQMKDKGIVQGAAQYYTGAGTAQGQPSPYGGGTPEKLLRLQRDEIPDIYEGSYIRYLLSQPTVGAQDAARDRQDYYQILKDLHLPPQRRIK